MLVMKSEWCEESASSLFDLGWDLAQSVERLLEIIRSQNPYSSAELSSVCFPHFKPMHINDLAKAVLYNILSMG